MDKYRAQIAQFVSPLAIEFFATFSRFEFALKRGGFLGGGIGEKAEANWDTFAGALEPSFFAAMLNASAARIFFEAPPKNLIRVSIDDVEYQQAAVIDNGPKLFVAVRRVRNNLLHGEKFYIGDRDEALMRAALFVLDSAMAECSVRARCQKVPGAFQYAHIVGQEE
ncbi:MAG TPA: hypothetical protein VHA70_11500 [Bauldia sp.]|nr:hypothetical protein [Bauldia sp.]